MANGLTLINKDNDLTLFSGDFTGRKSMVAVKATEDGKNVYGVGVILDSSKEWKTLVNTYNYYKDIYKIANLLESLAIFILLIVLRFSKLFIV